MLGNKTFCIIVLNVTYLLVLFLTKIKKNLRFKLYTTLTFVAHSYSHISY